MAAVEGVLQALRHVLDPEIGVNVVDLGLVYGLEVHEDDVRVFLTVTTPTCPLSEYLTEAAERMIMRRVPGVRSVVVEIVMDPPWEPEMMSDDARQQLGWGG